MNNTTLLKYIEGKYGQGKRGPKGGIKSSTAVVSVPTVKQYIAAEWGGNWKYGRVQNAVILAKLPSEVVDCFMRLADQYRADLQGLTVRFLTQSRFRELAAQAPERAVVLLEHLAGLEEPKGTEASTKLAREWLVAHHAKTWLQGVARGLSVPEGVDVAYRDLSEKLDGVDPGPIVSDWSAASPGDL